MHPQCEKMNIREIMEMLSLMSSKLTFCYFKWHLYYFDNFYLITITCSRCPATPKYVRLKKRKLTDISDEKSGIMLCTTWIHVCIVGNVLEEQN